jgi:hypothetical protein
MMCINARLALYDCSSDGELTNFTSTLDVKLENCPSLRP